jgi:hypothetical protein
VVSNPSEDATSIARRTIFPGVSINRLTGNSPSSQQPSANNNELVAGISTSSQQPSANTFLDPSQVFGDSANDELVTGNSPSSQQPSANNNELVAGISTSSQQPSANTVLDPSQVFEDSANDELVTVNSPSSQQPSAWVPPPGGIWSLYKSTYIVYPGGPHGEVFFAAHRIGDRSFSPLLIKHLATNTRSSAERQARIEREVTLLRRCIHPNVISFQAVFEDFLVFRDIIRISLNALIGCLELREQHTAVIFRELIQGLSHIHGMEIFHGAIAPPNILFSDSGDLVICMGLSQRKRVCGVLLTVGSKLRGGKEQSEFSSRYSGSFPLPCSDSKPLVN